MNRDMGKNGLSDVPLSG